MASLGQQDHLHVLVHLGLTYTGWSSPSKTLVSLEYPIDFAVLQDKTTPSIQTNCNFQNITGLLFFVGIELLFLIQFGEKSVLCVCFSKGDTKKDHGRGQERGTLESWGFKKDSKIFFKPAAQPTRERGCKNNSFSLRAFVNKTQ